jgi:hypothetical protein
MTKNELVDFCYCIVDDIFDYNIGNNSVLFWCDGGYDGVSEYLYETIYEYENGNNNDLIDGFTESYYCKPIFENEIEKYKLQMIYLELFDDDIDSSFATTKEQIIVKWDKYKLAHEKVEMFDDDKDLKDQLTD